MCTLKELCKSIPTEVLREQTKYNVAKRSAQSYAKRMRVLEGESGVFNACVQRRPRAKKVHVKHENSCGSYLGTQRFGYTTVVVRKQS